jgi:ABC-type lipoprotein export system ATPase subunit
MDVFCQLNDLGQTIFMVTHNNENAALAHRVLNIRDGALVGTGRPQFDGGTSLASDSPASTLSL